MKRNLIATSSLVVLSLLLSATGAYAQAAVRAYVPFAFTVGTTQLPSGSYKITVASVPNTIMIRNCKTSATILSLVQPKYPGEISRKLVFKHRGNQYFLTEIWGAEGSDGMTLRAPKPAKELQEASGPANADKLVEIALK
jgi:hypothetical protein